MQARKQLVLKRALFETDTHNLLAPQRAAVADERVDVSRRDGFEVDVADRHRHVRVHVRVRGLLVIVFQGRRDSMLCVGGPGRVDFLRVVGFGEEGCEILLGEVGEVCVVWGVVTAAAVAAAVLRLNKAHESF